MGSRVVKGGTPAAPRRLPSAPAWRDDVPTAFAAVGPGRATLTAAWSPVDGAAGYRLELDGPGGAAVLGADLPASTTRVELHEAVPGTYTARVAAVDDDGLEGAPAPAREVRVVAIAVGAPGRESEVPDGEPPPGPMPPPGGGAAAPPAIVAQGGALGDETLACEGGGRTGAPLVMATTGAVTVRCTTVDGVAVAPFTVEVTAVTAVARGQERGVALRRGAHEEVAITLTSDVPLGDRWRVEPGPGLTCEGFRASDGGVTIRVAVDGAAPETTTLEVIDDLTGGRVAVLAVAVADPPRARIDEPAPPPPPVAPAAATLRPRVSAGVFLGWTAFPAGASEGLELGDPPLSAYQVDSGAGGGMRAAWWPRADLFVELEAGLWPTGFIAADEPAWIVGGHAVVGHRFHDGARLGARAVFGAGGYALLGDAAYASADVDPDVTWGLTGTWRLRPDLVLRLDGRHRIAPDRAPAGVTDVFELSVGLELPVIGTAAP
jgi:hypothetical protein